MGIPHLNRFLTKHCSTQSICKKHLQSFSGKTIAIDTSIYLYKFSTNGALMENMYSLVSLFRHYKMTPIFIFDGKPPDEKMDLLKRRQADKHVAEQKYNEMKKLLECSSTEDKCELSAELDVLKKQFIRIKREDIERVKTLFDSLGVMHCDAPGEADHMCAKMVINNQAWACLSDDMDMFVYGCTRVMRHISLMNHTVVFYNTTGILRELKMHMKHFREVMVLSGTDYKNQHKADLHTTMQYYRQFQDEQPNGILFNEWLRNRPEYAIDYDSFDKIYNMFYITDVTQVCMKQPIRNLDNMRAVLKPHGFIFV
jgi:flap endonuclease-1